LHRFHGYGPFSFAFVEQRLRRLKFDRIDEPKVVAAAFQYAGARHVEP
jgi:hypothetical protein